MTLDNIAEEIGTVTDEQHSDDFRRYSEGEHDLDTLDVQDEYDGGWTNTNA